MKLILKILLILTIIITISICAIQPDMHKNVMVYDSAYTPVAEQDVKTETQNIPVMELTTTSAPVTVKTETKTEPAITKKQTQSATVKQQTQTTPKQTAVKQTVSKPVTQTVKKPVTTTVTKPTVTTQTQKAEQPKTLQKVTVNTESKPPVQQQKTNETTTKVLTQQEETIAWNIWRSNLTNKIMQDTKMPDIPNGTVFQFSFDVDKYGKITNVKTGANPANYTPHAIQYIAPVIRSYQGKSILNFPEGTARTTTTVTGKWRISNTSRYSTPQDYNDVEKVIR